MGPEEETFFTAGNGYVFWGTEEKTVVQLQNLAGGSRHSSGVCGRKVGRKHHFEVGKSFSLQSYLFSVSVITSPWGGGGQEGRN